MRTFRVAAILLCLCSGAQAAWTLRSSELVKGTDPRISHFEKTVEDGRPVQIHLVVFETKACGVEVIDHPVADGGDLSTAMLANNCLAGTNGNYFQPDRTSLGLVISNGRMIHPLQKARLLSGLLIAKPNGVSLLRTAEYRPNPRTTQALQAGPFLIDHGKPVAGLDSEREAVRTVFLSDGNGRCALLVGGPITLAELAEMLAVHAIVPELKISRALNLDGGGSSGIWVRQEPKPFYLPEISAVRNYLAVIPRH